MTEEDVATPALVVDLAKAARAACCRDGVPHAIAPQASKKMSGALTCTGSWIVRRVSEIGCCVVLALVANAPAGAQTNGIEGAEAGHVAGIVFHDANGNGAIDSGEDGVAGVGVSNGSAVVKTDGVGRYKLPVRENAVVFVIKPTGWTTPVDENNLPRFYYVHRPDGSPEPIRRGVAPTGRLPASVDFPLYPNAEPERFSVVFFADTQPRDRKEIDYIAHDVVEELVGTDAAFGITLGDITHNDLSLFEDIAGVVGRIGVPWYHAKGNHDTNTAEKGNEFSSESFIRVFGPTYYSFDYGGVHFLVLNNAFWIPGEAWYKIRLDTDQMTFVRNDLALVPDDRLVVLMMHIPINEMVDRQELYRLLENRRSTFSVAGHSHTQEHMFIGEKDGWRGERPHHSLVNVAVCGILWAGAPDEAGIPHAMSYDGVPNGYSVATFDHGDYSIRYKAARRPAEYQMNVHVPDEVKAADAAQTPVFANVFAGSDRSVVQMRLDRKGEWVKMRKVNQADPSYMMATKVDAATSLPAEKKLPPIKECKHLWKGSLPKDLTPGVHLVEVQTTDVFDQVYTAHRLVRVR